MNLHISAEIRRLLEPHRFVGVEPIRPGMSGALIYRCKNQRGKEYALKRWPANTDADRIQNVHRVMNDASHAGCDLVPKLMTWTISGQRTSFLGDGDFYWDLSQWMPGQPVLASAPLTDIRNGARAIARFHVATAEVSSQQFGPQQMISPCVVQRCQMLQAMDHDLLESIQSSSIRNTPPQLADAILKAAGLLRFGWDQVRPKLFRSFSPYLEQPMMNQLVLRDVHREHVLFVSGRPSGLIDFDAVRIDNPAVDFARWAGSFIGSGCETEPIWAAILAGAAAENPSIDSDLDAPFWRLAQSLAQANPWISLIHWLRWLVIEERSFPAGPAVIAGRINELVESAARDMH